MEIGPQLLPRLQLKVTPKQIAANYILQLSSMELQDLINEELQENPALEQTESAVCPLCGNAITGPVCLTCFGPSASGTTTYDADFEPLEGSSLMLRDEEDDELNPIVRAEAEQTLAEYLLWNLRASLPRNLYAIAEYLVGNLDESGYLRGLESVTHLHAPVLFMAAQDDEPFSDDAHSLYAAAASADKQVEVVPGSAHGSGLLEDPSLKAAVWSFIAAHTR